MRPNPDPYVRALRFRWLTRFYDRVLAGTLKEEKFKQLLVEQAGLRPGQRALDVGCGTGTLTISMKRAAPGASVLGLDGDPDALAIARKKTAEAGVAIEFHEALAWQAPFAGASFDRILSSLVFHHLTTENKRRTLGKLREWLRPGGELHVADWGRPHDALMRLAFLPVQLLDGFETTNDSVAGRLPGLLQEAGFEQVAETHRERTLFGTLSLYRATRPEESR